MKTKDKYEEGGRVQISGKWYPIVKAATGLLKWQGVSACGWLDFDEEIIEAYEPPKKEVVHEWLDGKSVVFPFHSDPKYDSLILLNANEFLSEKYGAPPIVRTYNGEKAEEFGMDDLDYVLYWDEYCWDWCNFIGLYPGDKWMPQPPALKD